MNGGKLFLYGELPLFDMEGNPCEILVSALGAEHLGERPSSGNYYLSIAAENWAAPRAEVRANFAQLWKTAGAETLLRVCGTKETCGFEKETGKGKAIVITAAYACDMDLFGKALERLGTSPGLLHDSPEHGIFMTSMVNEEGERFIHILNLDGFSKTFTLFLNGKSLFGGRQISIGPGEGYMLPFDMKFPNSIKILSSTAEIKNISENSITFRLTQMQDVIEFESVRLCSSSNDYGIEKKADRIRVISGKDSRIDNHLTVRFS